MGMDQDVEHIRLLSIFHYVVAGIAALFACIPLIHLFLGLAMIAGVFQEAEASQRTIGVIFVMVAGCFILAGWTFVVLVFLAGRFLKKQRRYTFCLVMAAVECLFMPLGTVLGVFTIIVLMRDSVKARFGLAPQQ
jgi:hypothetical protein